MHDEHLNPKKTQRDVDEREAAILDAERQLIQSLFDYGSATHPDRSCDPRSRPGSTPYSPLPPQPQSPSGSSQPRRPDNRFRPAIPPDEAGLRGPSAPPGRQAVPCMHRRLSPCGCRATRLARQACGKKCAEGPELARGSERVACVAASSRKAGLGSGRAARGGRMIWCMLSMLMPRASGITGSGPWTRPTEPARWCSPHFAIPGGHDRSPGSPESAGSAALVPHGRC
jgi:hypothetical protein